MTNGYRPLSVHCSFKGVKIFVLPAVQCPPIADLLHAVAGLCSAALPDMEIQTIYSCLNDAGSKAILVIRDVEGTF